LAGILAVISLQRQKVQIISAENELKWQEIFNNITLTMFFLLVALNN
jgi:hypothetical protein